MGQDPKHPSQQLAMIAAKSVPAYHGLVEVVDFLNKSLKQEGYIFGVSKSGDMMTIVIYRTDSKPCV